MIEGTFSVYAFVVIFPLAVIGGLLFLIRNYIRTTEFCDADARFDGKTIVVTGGSSGLGRALAAELTRRGARVVAGCRTKARRDSTAYFLRSKTGSLNIRTMFLDLTSLDSVLDFCREIADTEDKVDAVVNNAAVLCPGGQKTSDELDAMHGVNYVGPFLLSNLLLEKLLQHGSASSPARLVNVVCGSLRAGRLPCMDDLESRGPPHGATIGYRSSKLALHLLTREMAHRHADEGLVAFSVDPGYVNTGLYKNLEGMLGQLNQTCAKALYRTTEEGIQTILHVLASKDVLKDSGKMFKDCSVCDARSSSWTEQASKELWERTAELLLSKGFKLKIEEEEEEEPRSEPTEE